MINELFSSCRVRLSMKAGLLALFFLSAFSAKGWLIEYAGSQMPFSDQWDAELCLFRSVIEGDLSLREIFSTHNEHRIVFTRLLWLLIFRFNGEQADNLVDVFAMALLSAASFTVLLWIVLEAFEWTHWKFVTLAFLVTCCLPFTWENAIWGVQSLWTFQILFTILAFAGLGLEKPQSPWWWVGALSLVACLFTAASGFLAGLAILFVKALTIWRFRRLEAGMIPTMTLSAVVVTLGVLLVPETAAGESYKAGSVAEFLIAFLKNLAWPWEGLPFLGYITWLPVVTLLVLFAAGRFDHAPRPAIILLLLGSYVAANCLALAYTRGASGSGPAGRHLDFHHLGLLTNLLALPLLMPLVRRIASIRVRRACRLGIGVWAAVVVTGAVAFLAWVFRFELADRRERSATQTRLVRAFLGDDNPAHFENRKRFEIPYQNFERLVSLLRDPIIREILPPSLQPPAEITWESASGVFESIPEFPAEPPPHLPNVISSYRKNGGKGHTRSGPVTLESPYFSLWFAGYPPDDNLRIILTDDSNGESVSVRFRVCGSKKDWRLVALRSPGGPFRIQVEDDRRGGWLALSAPLKTGYLSALALMCTTACIFAPLVVFTVGAILTILSIDYVLGFSENSY